MEYNKLFMIAQIISRLTQSQKELLIRELKEINNGNDRKVGKNK